MFNRPRQPISRPTCCGSLLRVRTSVRHTGPMRFGDFTSSIKAVNLLRVLYGSVIKVLWNASILTRYGWSSLMWRLNNRTSSVDQCVELRRWRTRFLHWTATWMRMSVKQQLYLILYWYVKYIQAHKNTICFFCHEKNVYSFFNVEIFPIILLFILAELLRATIGWTNEQYHFPVILVT